MSTKSISTSPCRSLGRPDSDVRCALFNQMVKENDDHPEKKWAFEISGTTPLHLIIANTGLYFQPSEQYWVDRIVREGGEKVINWCRSSDGFTPLHLVKTAERAELLLINGADPKIVDSFEMLAIQKIATLITLPLPTRSYIYRIFLKYGAPSDGWEIMTPAEDAHVERVKEYVAKRRSLFMRIFTSDEHPTTIWLPRDVIRLIASNAYF